MTNELWRSWITDITLDIPAGGHIEDAIQKMINIARSEKANVHADINDIWVSVGPDDTKGSIVELFRQAQEDREELEKKKEKQPELGYDRRVVYRDKDVEIVAIVWPPHSSSRIHDHGKSYGITRVVKGYIIEESWDKATRKLYIQRRFGPGQELSETPHQIHRISNETDEIAVTVHIYNPPLKMKFYTEKQMFGSKKK